MLDKTEETKTMINLAQHGILTLKIWNTIYLVSLSSTIVRNHRLDGLNNIHFFPAVLKARKFKTKVPAV